MRWYVSYFINRYTELAKIFDKSIYKSFERKKQKMTSSSSSPSLNPAVSFIIKIDLKCKSFDQKKVLNTCRVRGQIIIFFIYFILCNIKEKKHLIILSNNLILFFFFDWQMLFFFLVHWCYKYIDIISNVNCATMILIKEQHNMLVVLVS